MIVAAVAIEPLAVHLASACLLPVSQWHLSFGLLPRCGGRLFSTLYLRVQDWLNPGSLNARKKVAELLPPDAPADVSPTDLAFCWAIFAGLFEPPGSREKQKEIKPPRLPPLAWCLGIIASLDD